MKVTLLWAKGAKRENTCFFYSEDSKMSFKEIVHAYMNNYVSGNYSSVSNDAVQ